MINLEKNQIIEIWAKPKSSKSNIEYDKEKDKYIVYLNSPPEDGKANNELIKLFKKQYGVKVELISGEKGRKKIIKIL
jgi:hypothetical protein